jgi:hypothetical protein
MKESEYDGGGVMPNGVYPQDDGDHLSARDKLRLLSRTGQTEDSHAPVDPYFWYGNMAEEPVYHPRRPRKITQRQRYTESPT